MAMHIEVVKKLLPISCDKFFFLYYKNYFYKITKTMGEKKTYEVK